MHIVLTMNAAWNALNFRKPILMALIQRGHRVTVLAPEDSAVPALRALGCEVVHFPMEAAGLSPLSHSWMTRAMTEALRSLQPHMVLSFTPKNNICAAEAGRRLGLRVLPNVCGLGTAFLSGAPLRWMAERLYSRAFRGLPIVFFQNADDARLFEQRGIIKAAQARLVPGSGVDVRHFRAHPLPASAEGPLFLFLGRILRQKGAVEFAAAAKRVKRVWPRARFRMLGDLDAQNRSAVSAQEVQGWVAQGALSHHSAVADVRPAIASADCLVLPSYREGAPRTLMEGAAMGRPAIATDVPGCRDVVLHNDTGLLVRPQDPEDLAVAMGRFVAMPHRDRVALGDAARRRMVEVFDQSHVVTAYLDAIGDLSGRLQTLAALEKPLRVQMN